MTSIKRFFCGLINGHTWMFRYHSQDAHEVRHTHTCTKCGAWRVTITPRSNLS